MTGKKSRMSSNICQIGLTITELLVIFDWIFYRLAGNEDRHKNLDKFKIQPDPIFHAGVSCP